MFLTRRPAQHAAAPPRATDSGASGAEFAGALIIVALIISGLFLAAPGWGRSAVCAAGSAVASALGGTGWDCGQDDGQDDTEADKHKPTEPCTNSQRSHGLSGSVEFTVVAVEVRGGIVVEELSDGTYRVTDKRGLQVGATTGVGGGVEVTIDNESYGAYEGAGAGAGKALEGGATYTASSEEDKNELVRHLTLQGTAGVAGAAANWGINKVKGYEPPAPTEYYVEFGLEGSASADATSGASGANAEAGASVALGMKVNTEDNTVTTYYRAGAQAGAQAGQAGIGGEAEGSAEVVVAVTADADTREVVNVSASAMAEGSLTATTPLGEPGSLSGGQLWTASLDTTSAGTRSEASDLLAAAGIPSPWGGKAPAQDLGEATTSFVNAASERGVLTRQDVDKTTSRSGAKASLEEGLVAGLGLGYTDETTRYSNGQYYDGSRWQDWEGC